MDRIAWVAAGTVVLAAVGLTWAMWPAEEALPPEAQVRTGEEGGVTVEVTMTRATTLRFEVTLDSHTVDLSGFDPAVHARIHERGVFTPPSASAIVTPGAHHVRAVAEFAATSPSPTFVVLDLGGVAERRFDFS